MPLGANLVAYYVMSGSSGAGETDQKGSYNLTLTGTVNSQTGKSGNARGTWATDNTNYLRNSSFLTTGPAVAQSISAWIYLNATSGNMEAAISLGGLNSGDWKFEIRKDTANKFNLNMEKNQVAGNQVSRGSAASTGIWYHVVVTYDGANNGKLYVNAGTAVTATFSQTGVTTDTNIMIGGTLYDGGGGTKTNSAANLWIDEVGVWNRELSATEVTQLYAGGAGMFYNEIINNGANPVGFLVYDF